MAILFYAGCSEKLTYFHCSDINSISVVDFERLKAKYVAVFPDSNELSQFKTNIVATVRTINIEPVYYAKIAFFMSNKKCGFTRLPFV